MNCDFVKFFEGYDANRRPKIFLDKPFRSSLNLDLWLGHMAAAVVSQKQTDCSESARLRAEGIHVPVSNAISRRRFLAALNAGAAAPLWAAVPTLSSPGLQALRREIVASPDTIPVGLHRARTFTRVFQANESKPFMVRKALALRTYFETVPLYLRPNDRIAGSISEQPGAMPLIVEIGICEDNIYTGENPNRVGYLKGKVPQDISDYWLHRNLWGFYRDGRRAVGTPRKRSGSPETEGQGVEYKFISNQGHLSPSYAELLEIGIGGILKKVRARRRGVLDPGGEAFLDAAENALLGLSAWIERYAEFLERSSQAEMARIARAIVLAPPGMFRQALQLIWFAQQAIQIEGHGYSCSPDHLDQLLLPYYRADIKAGRLTDRDVVEMFENFALKIYDNSFWGPEHHLDNDLCAGGSAPDGRDLTNRLSRLLLEAVTNLALPEPIIWIRWHERLDQDFFDFSLTRIAKSTCFPIMFNDKSITAGLMKLGVSRQDAFNYLPVGCNELAIPGQFYFNPGANANYLGSLEAALTSGRGYKGDLFRQPLAPPAHELKTFDDFVKAFAAYLRASIESSYQLEMGILKAQMKWGVTPLASCFFHGCVEKAHDMAEGTKYNILSCGGIFFANAVDALAAIRAVVYENREATLGDIAAACRANFSGHERLRAKLLAAPKHGNDDSRLDDIIRITERVRCVPVKEICRDPRDGTPMGNCHVVRSSAVRVGRVTGATPDGRLAGTPLASSVAASVGCEHSGPTALLNSVCKLNGPDSWPTGYQVNLRLAGPMLTAKANRDKVRAMLNVYFTRGGQQIQINSVNTEMLRAAQRDPSQYRDLVVRVAGFSEFFVNLTPDIQEDIIARTEHM